MDHAQENGPVHAETLLAQAAWVKALARRLVRDDATAQDVVQETWLAALRAAPVEPGRLRPWLAHVLANFARRAGRGDLRRVEREARAARTPRAEVEPAADEIVCRIELQRRLVEALDGLDEPYRRTVVLRWLDGLDAAEIARREGVPAGTVRWRLAEGLERLRKHLDAGACGDRAQWALLCMPFTPRPSLAELAGLAAAASTGVLLMSISSRAALAGVLLVGGLAGLWWWTSAQETPASPRLESRAAARVESPPPTAAQTELDRAGDAALRDAAVAAPVARGAPAAPSAAKAPTGLEGRCVDDARRPLVGVEVELAFPVALGIDGAARTGTDGRFRVECPSRQETWGDELTARLPGKATLFRHVELEPGRTNELGDLVLHPGAVVFGRVLDGDDRPVEDARVVVVRAEAVDDAEELRRTGFDAKPGVLEARSGAGGAFEIAGAPAAVVRIAAGVPDRRWALTETIELAALARQGPYDLRLAPHGARDRIAGIVLDPRGAPVPNAEVGVGYATENTSTSSSIAADEQGRFDLKLEKEVPHDFLARGGEHGWTDVPAERVEPGTLDLVLRFAEPRWCELLVQDERGERVPEFEFELVGLSASAHFGGLPQKGDAEGTKRFALPGRPFTVRVSARGYAVGEIAGVDPAAEPERLVCTLRALPGLRGRVVAGDRPVPGARLALHRVMGPGERFERNGFPSRVHVKADEETVAGEEGRFVLTPRVRAGYAIQVEHDGYALAELVLADVDPDVGAGELEIALVRGGAIEGRVLLAEGRSPAGAIVAFDRHDGRPRTLRADREGRFRLEGLTPGDWHVRRTERELRSDTSTTSWSTGDTVTAVYETNCVVEDGKTTRFDIDLRHEEPVVLALQLTLDGVPAIGWRVTAAPAEELAGPGHHPAGATDSRGDLALPLERPGSYVIDVVPAEEIARGLTLRTTQALVNGANPLRVELRRAALRVRWDAPPEDYLLEYRWKGPNGFACTGHGRVDADGRWKLPFLPAGDVEVGGYDTSVQPWRVLAKESLVLRAGTDPEVELR